MDFSVLISSYCKDNPQELIVALRSIWDDQTLKPTEIVVVKDGPLTAELDFVIADFAKRAPVKTVPLEKNQGLGLALAEGVKHCTYDYIARMDSDDISLPDRFEKQTAFMEQHPEVAICGGMIQEFSDSPENITGKRILPINNDEIKIFLKWRSPFSHVTVFFKKEVILNAGNYQHFLSYEDYWLWARVMADGNIGANLPDILVNVRAGENMLTRRKGWRFFKAEIALAQKLHSVGVLNWFEMYRNIMLRASTRLMPLFLLRLIYSYLRKK